jgi:hypothetical protein
MWMRLEATRAGRLLEHLGDGAGQLRRVASGLMIEKVRSVAMAGNAP